MNAHVRLNDHLEEAASEIWGEHQQLAQLLCDAEARAGMIGQMLIDLKPLLKERGLSMTDFCQEYLPFGKTTAYDYMAVANGKKTWPEMLHGKNSAGAENLMDKPLIDLSDWSDGDRVQLRLPTREEADKIEKLKNLGDSSEEEAKNVERMLDRYRAKGIDVDAVLSQRQKDQVERQKDQAKEDDRIARKPRDDLSLALVMLLIEAKDYDWLAIMARSTYRRPGELETAYRIARENNAPAV
jgi:hypothetical protein